MMNPTEIADALDAISKAQFDAAEFGYAFAQATDNAQATVAKLRAGTTNKSDIAGGVLLNGKFHYAPALPGMTGDMLDALRASKRTAKAKPAILIATDGEMIAAEHPKSGETLHCPFAELGTHFSFFLPAAGKERYRAAEENPVDIKATGKLAKLYDALLKANPDWAVPERRHALNLFMTRLIFCLFSEDVGVFKEDQFSFAVFSYGGNKGEHARDVLVQAFSAMNLPKGKREGLPAWTDTFEYPSEDYNARVERSSGNLKCRRGEIFHHRQESGSAKISGVLGRGWPGAVLRMYPHSARHDEAISRTRRRDKNDN